MVLDYHHLSDETTRDVLCGFRLFLPVLKTKPECVLSRTSFRADASGRCAKFVLGPNMGECGGESDAFPLVATALIPRGEQPIDRSAGQRRKRLKRDHWVAKVHRSVEEESAVVKERRLLTATPGGFSFP